MRLLKWKYVLQCLLGLAFVVSAILKLISVDEFELYVFSLGFGSFDLSTMAVRLLIVGEAILGIGLILDAWHSWICWLTALVLSAFSCFLIWRWSIGDESNCHCFGELMNLNPWQSLIKNAFLGIGLGLVWHPVQPGRKRNNILFIVVSVVLSVGYLSSHHRMSLYGIVMMPKT